MKLLEQHTKNICAMDEHDHSLIQLVIKADEIIIFHETSTDYLMYYYEENEDALKEELEKYLHKNKYLIFKETFSKTKIISKTIEKEIDFNEWTGDIYENDLVVEHSKFPKLPNIIKYLFGYNNNETNENLYDDFVFLFEDYKVEILEENDYTTDENGNPIINKECI